MEVFNPRTPFTRRQAAANGLRDQDLRSGNFRRLTHDSRVDASVPDDLVLRSRAALQMVGPGFVLSHHTAASLWGGFVPLSSYVHVAMQGHRQLSRAGLKLHRFTYPMDTSMRHGLPVTTPEMTFAHLARELDTVDLVAFGDSLVRRAATTPNHLRTYTATWVGQKLRAAMDAASLVRSGVDSVQESRTRLLLHYAGLPEPEADIRVFDDAGSLLYRLDMGYRDLRLAIEFDGAWHGDPEQTRRDHARRKWLTEAGWTVAVITSRDLFEQPEAVLHQVVDLLHAAGGWRGRRLSDRWRRHFRTPVRAA